MWLLQLARLKQRAFQQLCVNERKEDECC
eukprot:COSAG06_NODE_8150_length_2257_cov_3.066728_1_plen_28_part_10